MYNDNAIAKNSQVRGFCWDQVIEYRSRGIYDVEAGDELTPDIDRVISRAKLGDKLYAAENKLSKANALFTDIHNEYFTKPKFNIQSDDETERRDAAGLLSKYPHWRLLLEYVLDTTLETERILKELGKEV